MQRRMNYKLIKSKLFIKLFLSYIIIISLIFSVYLAYSFFQYTSAYRKNLFREYEVKTIAFGNAFDSQIMSAQSVISSINSSATIKSIHTALFNENRLPNTYLIYQGLAEIKNIKGNSNNYNIYSTLLLFNNYNRAYSSSSVILLENNFVNQKKLPFIEIGNVSQMIDGNSVSNIILKNEYIIYGDEYSYSTSTTEKGVIFVLFNKDRVLRQCNNILGDYSGFDIQFGAETSMSQGKNTGTKFSTLSSVNPNFIYNVYVDLSMFSVKFDDVFIVTQLIGFLISITFVILAFVLSRKYYSPIGNIEELVKNNQSNQREAIEGKDEFEEIILGLQSLIGERNGYRERFTDISTYAEQGMLHGILSGNLPKDNIKVLLDESYIDLKKPYFVLALANLHMEAEEDGSNMIELVEEYCQSNRSNEYQLYSYGKDKHNIFIIVNSDEQLDYDSLFHRIHKELIHKINNSRCLITIGVGNIYSSIDQLSDACIDAKDALDGMISGGRDAVYFLDKEDKKDGVKYYFPKNFEFKLAKAFREHKVEDLHALLFDLYEKNIRNYDASPTTVHLMFDELHVLTLNAVKSISTFQKNHIQIDKYKQTATIEEIFDYYHAIYDTICRRLQNDIPRKDTEKLEQAILECIDHNLLNPNLSLNFVAEQLHVSDKYVSAVFKMNHNVTYSQYIQEKRIEQAVRMLQETSRSIEEIAQECGYTNMLTFRRNFRSVMKVNPSDYRNQKE